MLYIPQFHCFYGCIFGYFRVFWGVYPVFGGRGVVNILRVFDGSNLFTPNPLYIFINNLV